MEAMLLDEGVEVAKAAASARFDFDQVAIELWDRLHRDPHDTSVEARLWCGQLEVETTAWSNQSKPDCSPFPIFNRYDLDPVQHGRQGKVLGVSPGRIDMLLLPHINF